MSASPAADPSRIHFAAHSHHPWPDVTEAAHAAYWADSNALADAKWEKVFGEVVPKAQAHIARMAKLSDPRQVAFELIATVLGCFRSELLFGAEEARARARAAFERLLADHAASAAVSHR